MKLEARLKWPSLYLVLLENQSPGQIGQASASIDFHAEQAEEEDTPLQQTP